MTGSTCAVKQHDHDRRIAMMNAPDQHAPLLRIAALEITAPGRDLPLLGPLDLQLQAGQCLGLIGESGSGKSLTVLSLM